MKCFVSWGKGKQKADKNRARVEENFLKLTHVQRQEAAQSRREEKKRAEKERIMNEEDPEKQRRLEVRQTFFSHWGKTKIYKGTYLYHIDCYGNSVQEGTQAKSLVFSQYLGHLVSW